MASATATVGMILCDGCGLGTTSEHIAKRLRRLELTTRFRPIHIQTVFLSAQSPAEENGFLYGSTGEFTGEAATLLRACGIEPGAKDSESALNEFQRRGLFLTHVIECVSDGQGLEADKAAALRKRLPATIRKIRGSLRPKRVVVLGRELQPVMEALKAENIGAGWVLDGETPFDLSEGTSVSRLTSAIKSL
jgi:hypothetical protein